MSTDPTVLVAGARTPMGRMSGSLKGFSGSDLGGFAIKGALDKAGVAPDELFDLTPYAGAYVRYFVRHPTTQLMHWSSD